jgi:hypothetical protein
MNNSVNANTYVVYSMQVVDASWYMPDEQRNPIQEYQVLT